MLSELFSISKVRVQKFYLRKKKTREEISRLFTIIKSFISFLLNIKHIVFKLHLMWWWVRSNIFLWLFCSTFTSYNFNTKLYTVTHLFLFEVFLKDYVLNKIYYYFHNSTFHKHWFNVAHRLCNKCIFHLCTFKNNINWKNRKI